MFCGRRRAMSLKSRMVVSIEVKGLMGSLHVRRLLGML